MRFDWDPEKARTNVLKHDVSFELAQRVWHDPHHRVRLNQVVEGEERWQATGVVGSVTLLVVVFVEQDTDRFRIISARKATRAERREHEQQAL